MTSLTLSSRFKTAAQEIRQRTALLWSENCVTPQELRIPQDGHDHPLKNMLDACLNERSSANEILGRAAGVVRSSIYSDSPYAHMSLEELRASLTTNEKELFIRHTQGDQGYIGRLFDSTRDRTWDSIHEGAVPYAQLAAYEVHVVPCGQRPKEGELGALFVCAHNFGSSGSMSRVRPLFVKTPHIVGSSDIVVTQYILAPKAEAARALLLPR